MQRLQNQVSIVTGAASGIGNAVANLFAEEGAHVILADANGAKVGSAAADLVRVGLSASAFGVDVSDESAVQQMIDGIIGTFGKIDVLVNAAGILELGTLEQTSLASWNRTMDVNVTGTFLCCKAVIPVMSRSGGGSIVNFSSSTSSYRAARNSLAYTASKGGILALTKSVAVDYAAFNIRVNAVCPGPTKTPILATVSEEQLNDLKSGIPLGRLAECREIANAVLFLACGESSFVTGASIPVDGGQTVSL